MPVRDGGGFLAAAVDSILSQSLRQIELIVVDDHSRDLALESLATEDPRLRVIANEGQGVSSAFNTGMSQARGAYMARMDADDIALPRRLEHQIDYFRSHSEVAICGACVEIFSDRKIEGGNRRYQAWLNDCRSPQAIQRELFIESPIPNPTTVFRREALHRLNGYQDPSWPEDYDLFLRADAMGMQMGKPDDILLRWRDHPSRLTRSDERYALERFQAAKAHYLAAGRLRDAGKIIIWGAGPSGRLMCDLLLGEGVDICGFLEVHPRRIGGLKRGLPVWSFDDPNALEKAFVVVAVGAAGAREEIRCFLSDRGRREGRDYLFVA
jgi:glycosyltransferase involved in cell wall biosynthesis